MMYTMELDSGYARLKRYVFKWWWNLAIFSNDFKTITGFHNIYDQFYPVTCGRKNLLCSLKRSNLDGCMSHFAIELHSIWPVLNNLLQTALI